MYINIVTYKNIFVNNKIGKDVFIFMSENIKETRLIDDKRFREKCIDRMEVLDKVKTVLLIPEMECMTVQQVAEYYNVPIETIRSQYKENRDEFESDGAIKHSINSIKGLIGGLSTNLKTTNYRGRMEIQFDENTKLVIPNVGIILFPKRAILRMGMLLRDSKIAKEVRTQLLNIVEHTAEEKPEIITKEIDIEQGLYLDIGKAFATGDIMQFAQATQKLTEYQNRHIAKLKAEKEVLAANILKWTDRASANRLIRVLNGKLRKNFGETYGLVYKELLYKFHINLKLRGDKPWIQHLKDDEWICLYKVVAALCETNHINISKLFKEAKIDIEDLCL